MAPVSSTIKALLLAFVVAAFSAAATVSAQEMAPAPSPDAGSALSLPVSGALSVFLANLERELSTNLVCAPECGSQELGDDVDAESSETAEDAEVAFDDGADMDAEVAVDDGEDMDVEVPRETNAEAIVDVGSADTEVVAEVEGVVVGAVDEVGQMDGEVGSMGRGVVEEVGAAEKAAAYLVEPIVHSSPSPVPVEAVESPFGGQIGSSHLFEGSDWWAVREPDAPSDIHHDLNVLTQAKNSTNTKANTFVKKPTQNTSPATNTRRRRPTHVASFALFLQSLASMAPASSTIKALFFAFVVAAFSAAATVSAQEMAPAPAPDAGSALSLPVSGALVGASLLLSLLAFSRH
ncbi:hypothetical protein RJ640_010734 [Escallonia rubra]|uniref:Uncharacterized protein n=1 Tax=Escallonia rubra TaxID=112253 RepID=A0AA88UPY2_9ASTE|nr:hypothetical protein RJ640_010734 [Escallonia rubra]